MALKPQDALRNRRKAAGLLQGSAKADLGPHTAHSAIFRALHGVTVDKQKAEEQEAIKAARIAFPPGTRVRIAAMGNRPAGEGVIVGDSERTIANGVAALCVRRDGAEHLSRFMPYLISSL